MYVCARACAMHAHLIECFVCVFVVPFVFYFCFFIFDFFFNRHAAFAFVLLARSCYFTHAWTPSLSLSLSLCVCVCERERVCVCVS